jgi:hypothetical protein
LPFAAADPGRLRVEFTAQQQGRNVGGITADDFFGDPNVAQFADEASIIMRPAAGQEFANFVDRNEDPALRPISTSFDASCARVNNVATISLCQDRGTQRVKESGPFPTHSEF